VPEPVTSKTPLTRDRAWAYVLLNLSVPGWGSLKCGRTYTGIGELILLFAGLSLIGAWFFEWMARIVESELDETLASAPAVWLWKTGIACIAVSCVWTVVTCISIVREARAYEKENSRNVPPRLSDLPKPPKLS
jgi:hypothetical protein